MSHTPVSSLGEFGLIERITRNFQSYHQMVTKGIGDDAAVVDMPGSDKVMLFSNDLLLEGVHFDLSYSPLRHLGYKAIAVNVSDICAMNGTAFGVMVSIGLSSRFPVEAVEELYAGVRLACEHYQLDLLGGDTTSSKQGLMISVSAFGIGDKEKITYRNGANVKDLICVTGDVGAAYAGFLILDREKQVFLDKPDLQPDLSDYDYVIGRQLKPDARKDIIKKLASKGIVPSSMMDISDGIASELHHICQQSSCGATIYSGKLPIDYQTVSVAEEFQVSPTTFALNGGEDYELMFTVPLTDFEQIKLDTDIHIIGHITADVKQIQIVLDDGSVAAVEAQGWEHFSDTSVESSPS